MLGETYGGPNYTERDPTWPAVQIVEKLTNAATR